MDFFHTTVTEAAISRVNEVLRSGFLNEGAVVKSFESGLKDFLKSEHVWTVNSATSALFLCLRHLEVGQGDEVIVSPQTFIASGLVILHAGAKPVFADIDPLTGNISPTSIREKITPNTKAIMAVHWGGEPCDMDEIGAIAREFKLPVIEDAAHAFGAEYKGRMIGTISRFTCFSFQAIKGMTSGDGGAISMQHANDAERILRLRWFGMDKSKAPVTEIGERTVDVSEAGYKHHMNNIVAAIGLGNLESYNDRLSRRRDVNIRYNEGLANTPGVTLRKMDLNSRSACWLYTLFVEQRVEFCRAMKARGVPVTVVDRRIDTHSVFGGLTPNLPGVEEFDRTQIHIPIHEGLSDEDVQIVISAVRAGW